MQTKIEVRDVDLADRVQAIAVQTLAFSADPVMRFMYPEPGAYLENFAPFAEAFGGKAFECGTAYQAAGFGGVAFWLPVGVHADTEALGAHLVSSVAPTRHADTFAVLEQVGAHHIEEPHWYLPMIGVDPSRQGQGLGSALLAHALRKCDAEHMPAYLESSNPANVPLYERHGFRVVGKIQAGASPIIYPMLRDAR
jgi:ribosomal protein S18 acetylase RimI-like enzyme